MKTTHPVVPSGSGVQFATPPIHRLAKINQPEFRVGLAIRRNKGDSLWHIVNDSRTHFYGHFAVGLMNGVTFVHKAKPMSCVAGYESTGEAVGNLTVLHKSWWRDPSMPAGVFASELIYDSLRRIFRMCSDYSPVDSADYLLLLKNGRALVGWAK